MNSPSMTLGAEGVEPAAVGPGEAPRGSRPVDPTAAASSEDAPALASAEAPLQRLVRAGFWVALLASALLIVVKVLLRFDVATPWDDAYIFQRYARNLLNGHGLAWNPGGEPTYGMTCPAVLGVAVPMQIVTRGNQALSALLTSLVPGVLFLALSVVMVLRSVDAGPIARRAALLFTAVLVSASITSDHFVSGMDTTLALSLCAGYIVTAVAARRSDKLGLTALLGVLGGMSFAVRPELVAFAVLVPAAQIALDADRGARKRGAIALGITAALFAAHLAFNALYFRSVLPLPFYAKSLGIYGPAIERAYRGGSTNELMLFAEAYWPMFVVIALDVLRGPRAYLRALSSIEKGVLAATLACLLFDWLFVMPIMGFAQRFFHPALPGLVFLSCQAIGRIGRSLASSGARADRIVLAVGALALGQVLVLQAPRLIQSTRDWSQAVAHRSIWRHFSVDKHAGEPGPRSYWFMLDRVSQLPDDLVIATTEVGLLGAVNPAKKIIDLAGLNERAFAHQPFSADRLFEASQPDLIYMPHPHYEEMIAAIRRSPRFSDYEEFRPKALGTKHFGIALWRGSRHYDDLRALTSKKLLK